jgi:Tol biopolymer transport system component
MTQLTTTGAVTACSISPDGKYEAYSTGSDKQSLRIRQLATATDLEILPPSSVHYIGTTFSPDGAYLYYVAGPNNASNDLSQIPVLGGSPRKLIHDVDSPVAFSPNANRIAFTRGNVRPGEDALMASNADGTGERVIATRKDPERLLTPYAMPSWSPDGKLIAFPVRSHGLYDHLSVMSVDGSQEQVIGPTDWKWMASVNWVRHGRALILNANPPSWSSAQIWEMSYPEGNVRPITKDTSMYQHVTMTSDSDVLSTIRTSLISNLWMGNASALGSRKAAAEIHQITTGTGALGFRGLVSRF